MIGGVKRSQVPRLRCASLRMTAFIKRTALLTPVILSEGEPLAIVYPCHFPSRSRRTWLSFQGKIDSACAGLCSLQFPLVALESYFSAAWGVLSLDSPPSSFGSRCPRTPHLNPIPPSSGLFAAAALYSVCFSELGRWVWWSFSFSASPTGIRCKVPFSRLSCSSAWE